MTTVQLLKRMFGMITLVMLAGCSRHYHPLEQAKKERLVSELISTAPQCSAFKEKLAQPMADDDGVDLVFHEALRAHCIKKDV